VPTIFHKTLAVLLFQINLNRNNMSNLILIDQTALNEFNYKLDSIISKLETKQENPKEWLSAQEAMDILKIKQTSLWAYRKSGKLTFTKINKKVYFSRKDILNLLDRHKIVGYNLKK
jgi:hypothetical protein